jgi:hypothetical protein
MITSMNGEIADNIFRMFLERLLARKLGGSGVQPSAALVRGYADHLLNKGSEPFFWDTDDASVDVNIVLGEDDLDEMERELSIFYETKLTGVLERTSEATAKTLMRTLGRNWAQEHTLQQQEISNFRTNLENRWGKPLNQLRILLTIVREWCQEAHERNRAQNPTGELSLNGILVRLLVRASQVTDEIICLLENGFADGAMARWRTLHEIGVIAAVLCQHGDDIVERYIAHQFVESKRAMEKYNQSYSGLGYKPMSQRKQRQIRRDYEKVILKYGRSFAGHYGWAAHHLKNPNPGFADLEAAAGKAEMRAHHQMANDNVHGGIKSMFVRLGLIDDFTMFLAGRSNAGLTEPGQTTALTLIQLAVRVCETEGSFEDLLIAKTLANLAHQIPRSFMRADRKLRKDTREQP